MEGHYNCTALRCGYESGNSAPWTVGLLFVIPFVVLVMIAELFDVSFDDLIGYGEPTDGESSLLQGIAQGNTDVVAENIADVVNLAPLLKPSILAKLSQQFERQGIDISDIITLAEYLNDESVVKLIEATAFDDINDELLAKFIPMLDRTSKEAIFQKILNGEMDWHFIKTLLPYADYIRTQIEAAVVEGALPWEALEILNEYYWSEDGYIEKRG